MFSSTLNIIRFDREKALKYNSLLAKAGASSPLDSFVVAERTRNCTEYKQAVCRTNRQLLITQIISFTFIFCLFFPSAFGQKQRLILTAEENSKWIDSLKILPLDQQLLTINDRLLSDTNVYFRKNYNDRIKIADSLGTRVYGEGKPSLIIGGYAMIIDNKTQKNKIVSLTKLLTPTYINSIFIISPNDPAAIALYGSVGQFGIIVMTVTKKKNVKQFKRLDLKPNY